jgi:GntR family negative regulator for fad regulon and positive regulator of fabA
MTTYQSATPNSKNWHPILKPAELAESRLIEAILNDTFPINSSLPGERELSELLGVTRPTLRETLQRLERDGWVEIHQGKSTRIRDYWKEGKLAVLNTLSEHPTQLPEKFVPDLLNVRLAMAPMYTELAVRNAPDAVVGILERRHSLDNKPENYVAFDWTLQHELTILGKNPVFIMMLNSFEDLFLNLAPYYFDIPKARAYSLKYYEDFANAAAQKDAPLAAQLTHDIMRDSLFFWQQIQLS